MTNSKNIELYPCESCGRQFLRKKNRNGRPIHNPKGVKRFGSLTCSRKCAVLYKNSETIRRKIKRESLT